MINNVPQFAKVFTPHDDVPRWPLLKWAEALLAAVLSAKGSPRWSETTVILNNAALIAVHCRQPSMALSLCYDQFRLLERLQRSAQGEDGIVIAMIQPLINIMRLQFRSSANDPLPPAEWQSGDQLAAHLDGSLTRGMCERLADVAASGEVTEVVNFAFAREFANAILSNKRDLSQWSVFEGQALRARVPSAARLSLEAETRLQLGEGGRRAARQLSPSLAVVYLPMLASGLDETQLADCGDALRVLTAKMPCSRSTGEILCEAIVQLSRHAKADAGLPMIDYLQQLGDMVLLPKYAKLFGDGRESLESDGYGQGQASSEVRSLAAVKIGQLQNEIRRTAL